MRKNWLIYSLLAIYTLLIFINAFGFETWLPGCLVTRFTGYTCFGCGLNTAAIQLISLNLKAAFAANPLIFAYVPVIIGFVLFDFYKFRGKLNQQATK